MQEGAELRDQQTAAYRDALLQLAEDLEAQEMEEAARAAEQARIEAELARLAAEARKAEEARRWECIDWLSRLQQGWCNRAGEDQLHVAACTAVHSPRVDSS